MAPPLAPRVLVTGASGFAGSHLVDQLAADGLAVVAWHRPDGAPPREARGVTWEAINLLDRGAVKAAIERVRPTAVYHCGGAAHVGRAWGSSEPTFAVNVRGTHHLIEALRESRVDARVLIPSSALVYAESDEPIHEDHTLRPASPYALSKLAQELVGQGNPGGPEVSIARAFNHFGPRQDPAFVAAAFARGIADIEAGRRAPVLTVGNLDPQRDLTDVRDTVAAYRQILERGLPGRAYNVCSGRGIAIRDLLDLLLARARVPIEIKADPACYRPIDQPVVIGNPARIRDELGWTARIPIERTLDDLLEFWRATSRPS